MYISSDSYFLIFSHQDFIFLIYKRTKIPKSKIRSNREKDKEEEKKEKEKLECQEENRALLVIHNPDKKKTKTLIHAPIPSKQDPPQKEKTKIQTPR